MRRRASGPGKGMYILFSNLIDVMLTFLYEIMRGGCDSPTFDRIVELPWNIGST